MTTTELNLTSPADILAALPHILGYIPTDDLIALTFDTAHTTPHITLRAAIRAPLTLTDDDAHRFPDLCGLTADRTPGALLIAITPEHRSAPTAHLLATVRTALHRTGILVHRTLTTATVTDAGHWLDPDTGHHGATKPYTDSAATALGVLQGRVIAASRQAMADEFTEAELAPEVDTDDLPSVAAQTAADLQRVISENGHPSTDLAARTALVVSAHVGLRDELLRLGADHELAAARTWTLIAAHHRGRRRAELLAMAALTYYAAQDTVRTGLALHNAREALDHDAELPTLALLTEHALQTALPPSRIRTLLTRDDSSRT
ncbi:DUF4192 family protein [Mycobacterium sp. 236(2023)]|uniref:DUF4192 family protein n=1 Tax=Mycobacterium sp. 236(2023) TaxID=3038163 RepID=UPI0024152C52|nr:DUF4192 family protein [Mycobacterium sp. 236(2023)]MDG4667934.1 DUF4192 family protein [Mycobacterium sp. 236(2023)]